MRGSAVGAEPDPGLRRTARAEHGERRSLWAASPHSPPRAHHMYIVPRVPALGANRVTNELSHKARAAPCLAIADHSAAGRAAERSMKLADTIEDLLRGGQPRRCGPAP